MLVKQVKLVAAPELFLRLPSLSFPRCEWVNRGKSCRSHILDCYAPSLPFPRSSFRFSLPPISARSVKEEGMSVRPSVVCHIGNQSVCSFASDFFPPVRHFPALLVCCRRWSALALSPTQLKGITPQHQVHHSLSILYMFRSCKWSW